MTLGGSSFDQCNTPACPGVMSAAWKGIGYQRIEGLMVHGKPYFCICALVIQTLSEHETASKEFGCGRDKYLQMKL
ncbi:expressed protein [Echinococcus multilocularis]|uniref:Expressed protein n=1 Tax=Echinococcus multilocularis TaxID=6211 RepID=A0A087W0H4_ECHMU|nr:expressed protein [Echinococcus multilocularis]